MSSTWTSVPWEGQNKWIYSQPPSCITMWQGCACFFKKKALKSLLHLQWWNWNGSAYDKTTKTTKKLSACPLPCVCGTPGRRCWWAEWRSGARSPVRYVSALCELPRSTPHPLPHTWFKDLTGKRQAGRMYTFRKHTFMPLVLHLLRQTDRHKT